LYDSGGGAEWVAADDVNADGKPDVLVLNGDSVGVLLGNGDGTFQTAIAYNSGSFGVSMAVADVDSDGKVDVVALNQFSDTASILLGNGDGSFQAPVAFGSGGYLAWGVAVADVNADGKLDLLITNCSSNNLCGTGGANGSVGVLINTSIRPTTIALTSSPNPSKFGHVVTFTATVTWQGPGTPTGTVSFLDGTTNLGNSPLNSGGVAVLTTSKLAVGTHNMTAVYNGDANFAPSTSAVLRQVVQGAIVVLSPTHLNFGNQTVGITSGPQNVKLLNTGNIMLTITSIGITGTNRDDFAQTNNCGTSIPPKGSCKISVTFTPTTTGTRKAAVSITDSAPDSPQSVPLTGAGVLPAVTFSPTSLTFPNEVVFTTSPAQPVTLTNTGAGVLKIDRISVTSPFKQTNNCPASMGPGTSCTIRVKFHPTTKGELHGAVSVKDNAPGNPQKVPLTGTGTFVQLTPAKLNFGTQPVGTKSLPKRIAVTNKGHAAVNIMKISITGADAGDFGETNTCGKQLPSGASCFIKVTFTPLKKGKRAADVSISDDGGGSPQKASLAGTGT
jgi:hypothetical protein